MDYIKFKRYQNMNPTATVLITGGTGLIGMRLSERLTAIGYRVIHLSRRRNMEATYPAYAWDVNAGTIDDEALQQADYIVTLAGAGIADERWTARRKQLIIDSRVKGIELIASRLKALDLRPKAVVGASAIGYYGDAGTMLLDESAPAGKDFLADSVQAWEAAYDSIAALDIRNPKLRIGIVLSTQGGALAKMLPTYKLGFGTYFGTGEQVYSWVHIDDVCNMFVHAIRHDHMTETYNAVAPQPVTNKELAEAIATAKGMNEVVFPAPAFALKLALGEMAAVVLSSSNLSAQRILDAGFAFEWGKLVPALRDLVEHKH